MKSFIFPKSDDGDIIGNPIARPDIVDTCDNICKGVDDFINKILIPLDNIITMIECCVIKRFISENFKSWAQFNYCCVCVSTSTPWMSFDMNGDHINITINVFENSMRDVTATFCFKTKYILGMPHSKFHTTKSYVWFVT